MHTSSSVRSTAASRFGRPETSPSIRPPSAPERCSLPNPARPLGLACCCTRWTRGARRGWPTASCTRQKRFSFQTAICRPWVGCPVLARSSRVIAATTPGWAVCSTTWAAACRFSSSDRRAPRRSWPTPASSSSSRPCSRPLTSLHSSTVRCAVTARRACASLPRSRRAPHPGPGPGHGVREPQRSAVGRCIRGTCRGAATGEDRRIASSMTSRRRAVAEGATEREGQATVGRAGRRATGVRACRERTN